jgi:hypothetical protein
LKTHYSRGLQWGEPKPLGPLSHEAKPQQDENYQVFTA